MSARIIKGLRISLNPLFFGEPCRDRTGNLLIKRRGKEEKTRG
jgi:hypothetical protein